jgi:hypothetical protein
MVSLYMPVKEGRERGAKRRVGPAQACHVGFPESRRPALANDDECIFHSV